MSTSQSNTTIDPYSAPSDRVVHHNDFSIRGSVFSVLLPLALLIANCSILVGTSNGWIGPAKPIWFILIGLGWLFLTPIMCWRSAKRMTSTWARLLVVLWTVAFAIVALLFNGWAVWEINATI